MEFDLYHIATQSTVVEKKTKGEKERERENERERERERENMRIS